MLPQMEAQPESRGCAIDAALMHPPLGGVEESAVHAVRTPCNILHVGHHANPSFVFPHVSGPPLRSLAMEGCMVSTVCIGVPWP